MKFQFFAERVNFGADVNLHMLLDPMNGQKRLEARPVECESIEDDGRLPGHPMLSLPKVAAQSLMDELWTVGLRPTQGQQSEGQVQATERHLADMRAITFAKLGVQKP